MNIIKLSYFQAKIFLFLNIIAIILFQNICYTKLEIDK